ncbi:pimeloyl-ACP methyl ester carboxylesterase [Saccharothrix tamanrassetensis]|uniref:Pimeloyl-ACP methyl ester carboxylesterase n=1 Tax=Saccharothrix tamanrassetensis TaxID=1051531 RepID=A0A841CJ75_9PSEU|nr:alpha/beta hydrolase [Saccharothrix tamanrassetensis]MBB5956065.1 pimeloyl-ACP methyl ester carboxylesterase [Saccharothrix tamanrassetensis]
MRRSLTLFLVLPVLASCTSVLTGSPTPGTVLEQRGPAGTVPAGLERFYGQQLGWGDCADYATTGTTRSQYKNKKSIECARLEVPLDYAKPDDRTIKLGLLRQKATGDRIGSLLLNPGGPGGSGMSAAASLGVQVGKTALGERFDLVGFDPRGVGASQPQVRCLTDTERDADRLDVDLDTSPAGVAQTEAENKAFAEKCAATTGAELLANVGTRDVVRDLDVMRSALGDEKLTYLGYSYGTHIGAGYAAAFPGNVRALVLDGAVDPTQNQVESLIAQGAGFQKAFDAFAAWCAQRQDCSLGKDPAGASKAFRDLTLPLAQRPVDVGSRKLSYNDAITGAIQAMYSEELWGPLNAGLTELKNNSGQVLLQLADAYYDRDAEGKYSSITDAFTAIKCVDEPRVTDRAVIDDVARRYKAAAPFLDDGNPAVGALDSCAFWPVPPSVQETKPVAGLPPVLVISTTGDPATPYQAGVNLAKELGGGLLTYEGNQHTVYLQGNECVDPAADAYLIDLKLPDPGKVCS